MSKIAKLKNIHPAEHTSSPFIRLQNEVDRLFGEFSDFFSPSRFKGWEQFEQLNLAPSMDVVEDKDHFSIQLEMPGMDEKDIHLSITDNVLTISGEKSTSKKNKNKKYVSREISYGKYERSISLPSSVDVDKVKANFKKGMLWIQLPKKEETIGGARDIKIEQA
ncbi:Hsp20/alpha crystallin family protein [Legionella longbeachae]|uniref:Putative small heat shock protein n=1 Tax=Legionella longbeachae serogroup 1 (strain NSW150) TaxID=661367 RepID=D3HLU1_LEGLN|nr:Hsp20/alpha crystallin family protein [Legionella longbeachae]VEE03852.1 small heat shock protein [Legionella oakridgensis]HBD7397366.1 Hsp20/alpha crystallin family protein [Legionella pneumophila]ARB93288.1 Hsp20/alpha crystallin family protein [Legionella longbeachae]ARM33648.1 Hsp20/alpha crystallin family protein [Legionella longbeachae]EEZ93514.1 putative heat shock protein [Legionella longbeachae D-4968]